MTEVRQTKRGRRYTEKQQALERCSEEWRELQRASVTARNTTFERRIEMYRRDLGVARDAARFWTMCFIVAVVFWLVSLAWTIAVLGGR